MAVRKREIVELVITAILLITIMVMIQIIIKEENEKHIKTIKFVMGSSITMTLVCCFPNTVFRVSGTDESQGNYFFFLFLFTEDMEGIINASDIEIE